MDLLPLQYFRKVAQMRHLTRAADELHITQPALSQTIARLEKELGVPLFDRQGRQIQLNAYGEVFLRQVDIALRALEEGRRELADMAGLERGIITIDSASLPHFPDKLQAFRVLYPDVQFQIVQVRSKAEKEEQLANGRIDLCISCAPIPQAGIHNEPIVTEEIWLAVPHSHRLAKREKIDLYEAAGESFVHFRKGHSFRDETDAYCEQAGFTPHVVCEVEDVSTMGQLVKSGVGIAFWLDSLLEENSPFHPVRIQKPACVRTYHLSWPTQRYLSAAARTFRDWLMQQLAVSPAAAAHAPKKV